MTIPFVYRIKELSTGRFYIGVKTAKGCHPNILGRKVNGYWTSSKIVAPKWKNDPLSFKIVDIIVCNCIEEALELEEFILTEADVVNSENYLNMNIGGRVFSTAGRSLSQSHRETLSKFHSGKVISDEQRLAISKANKGISRHSAEVRKGVAVKLKENSNAARTYIFISPIGVEYVVVGLKEFIKAHNLPDRNTIVRFLNSGKIPAPDQFRGERRDRLTGWEISCEL